MLSPAALLTSPLRRRLTSRWVDFKLLNPFAYLHNPGFHSNMIGSAYSVTSIEGIHPLASSVGTLHVSLE